MSWFYAKGSEKIGPIEEGAFADLVKSGQVTSETLVWKEGQKDWKPYRTFFQTDPDTVTCVISKKMVPKNDAIFIDNSWVSAECKPQALERIKSGIPLPGAIEYAGFWIRVAARLLDIIIVTVVSYLIIIIGFVLFFIIFGAIGMEKGSTGEVVAGIGMIIMFISMILISIGIPIVYETWMLARFEATLGKKAVGIKVIRADRSKLTLWRAFGRAWGYKLSEFTLQIGSIMAAFDEEEKRALHDHICDTRVIKA